jgi:ketosteroid isomerase-like protein
MTPDAEKKRDLIHRHAQAELEGDWDGALATMIDEPFYEHYPLGVQVRGRAAVKEQWGRLLAGTDFVSRATSARLLEWFSGDIAVQMYEWEVEGPDGTKVPSRSWAIFTFKDGLIESERIFSDSSVASSWSRCSLPSSWAAPALRRSRARQWPKHTRSSTGPRVRDCLGFRAGPRHRNSDL